MLLILSIIQGILAIMIVTIIVIVLGMLACFYNSGQISEEEMQKEIQVERLNRLYGKELV